MSDEEEAGGFGGAEESEEEDLDAGGFEGADEEDEVSTWCMCVGLSSAQCSMLPHISLIGIIKLQIYSNATLQLMPGTLVLLTRKTHLLSHHSTTSLLPPPAPHTFVHICVHLA